MVTEKRVNSFMITMSLIGGVIGFILGEIIIALYKDVIPNSILMGLYFGVLALSIGMMCLIAEGISPKLNGDSWKIYYMKTSWKFLIPCTFIALFILGSLFQFIYETTIGNSKNISDFVFLIDTSESMKNTDPNNERFEAVKNIVNNMKEDNRVAIFKFDDTVEKIQEMRNVDSEMKNDLAENLKKYANPSGETNIKEALINAEDELNRNGSSNRKAMVILLSDGEDNKGLKKDFNKVLKPYKEKEIPIHTIGMSKGNNFTMLKKIARVSDGDYYNIKEAKELKVVFNKIYMNKQQRILVDKRSGSYESSNFYAVLRIMLVFILSLIIPVGISFIFDNKNLLKSFIIGGILSGLGASLILEFGFKILPQFGVLHRGIAAMLISLIFTLIPVSYDVKDYSKKHNGEKKNLDSINLKKSSRNNFK